MLQQGGFPQHVRHIGGRVALFNSGTVGFSTIGSILKSMPVKLNLGPQPGRPQQLQHGCLPQHIKQRLVL